MPLYEYRCNSCGQTIEVIQKFSDPPLAVCQKCGGSLERLLSPPGLHFKGSGWYITDYARSGKPASGDGNGGKPAAKTESKTAGKKETTSTPAKSD